MPIPSQAGTAFADHFGIRPGRPSRDLLEDTCSAFSTLPWENLTKLLRKSSIPEGCERLRNPLTVVEEHIALGAGGTCFSLTNCLVDILGSFGFSARPVTADMRHGPETHCAALVEFSGGSFLMDPGYLVSRPVELASCGECVIPSPSGVSLFRRLDPGAWSMSTRDGSGLKWRYTVRLDEVPRSRFDEIWRGSFDLPGMNGLHMSMMTEGGRFYLHDGNLRIEDREGKRNVKLGNLWADGVSRVFGVDRDLAGRALEALKKMREAG